MDLVKCLVISKIMATRREFSVSRKRGNHLWDTSALQLCASSAGDSNTASLKMCPDFAGPVIMKGIFITLHEIHRLLSTLWLFQLLILAGQIGGLKFGTFRVR